MSNTSSEWWQLPALERPYHRRLMVLHEFRQEMERGEELLFLGPFVVGMPGGLVLSSLFSRLLLPTMAMIADGRRE